MQKVHLLFLSLCLAVASAVQPSTTPTPILKQLNKLNDDGSQIYGYESADGSFRLETKYPDGKVKGKYGYVDQYGTVREVSYDAGPQGFQPTVLQGAGPADVPSAGVAQGQVKSYGGGRSGSFIPPRERHGGNAVEDDGQYRESAQGNSIEDDGQYREDPRIYENEGNPEAQKQTSKQYQIPNLLPPLEGKYNKYQQPLVTNQIPAYKGFGLGNQGQLGPQVFGGSQGQDSSQIYGSSQGAQIPQQTYASQGLESAQYYGGNQGQIAQQTYAAQGQDNSQIYGGSQGQFASQSFRSQQQPAYSLQAPLNYQQQSYQPSPPSYQPSHISYQPSAPAAAYTTAQLYKNQEPAYNLQAYNQQQTDYQQIEQQQLQQQQEQQLRLQQQQQLQIQQLQQQSHVSSYQPQNQQGYYRTSEDDGQYRENPKIYEKEGLSQ